MATRRIVLRTFAALAISGVTLSLLMKLAKLDWRDFLQVDLAGFSLVVLFHLLVLLARGLLMAQLAKSTETREATPLAWMQLAARHQFVFTVLPTGLGDLLFPALAKHLVGRTTASAFAIIAQVRARDLIVLVTLAVAGGASVAGLPWLAAAIAALALPALLYTDRLFQIALRIVGASLPKGRFTGFLETIADPHPISPLERWRMATTSVFIWLFATSSVMAAFAAIGDPVSVGVAMLFLAGINFLGALAISIGGLGVSEAGGAAALMLADRSVKSASALALLTRPMLLVSILCASLLIDLTLSIVKAAYRRSITFP